MKRHATAIWKGALGDGTGAITTQSGALSDHGYSFKARFEDESGKSGTNPEELLAAAHAGCFAMQLSHFLAENGTPAQELKATATVNVEQVEAGFEIKSSAIVLEATVPGIERRNSTPAMPLSRAVEDTRIPEAPPPHSSVRSATLSTLAKGLPRRTTTPGTPPSRTIMLEPSPSAMTGTAGSSSRRNCCRSATSLGSNSHSAVPPDLNQTSGANGAFGVSLPETAGGDVTSFTSDLEHHEGLACFQSSHR